MPVSASAAGFGSAPTVLQAKQLSPTSFLVLFSNAMSAVGLTTIGNYTLTPQGPSLSRTITGVTIDSPISVVVTVNLALSVGTNAYEITVAGVTDAASNAIDVANDSAMLTVVGATGVAASRDGGESVTLSLPTINTGGRYIVHLGPLGNSNDPVAFSKVLGEGTYVRLEPGDTQVAVAKPSTGIGAGQQATFVALDPIASPSSFQSPTTVDTLPRQYYSGVSSLRRLFPSRYDVGPIDPAQEGAQ
jgi:hypothetical protein